MGKPRFFHKPRAVIQKRRSQKSKGDTLSTTIPRSIIQATNWNAGDILEFVAITEGTEWQERYVKVRKVSD